MKRRTPIAIAALAVVSAALYLGWTRADPEGGALPPVVPRADVAGTALTRAPAPPATTTRVDEVLPDLPASVSLDDGPPPLRLYRCAAYARLLAARKQGAEAAAFVASADEMDSVIALLRDMRQQAVEPGTDSGILDPDAVRQDVILQAEQVGSRLDAWLEESYARCDQEVAWTHEAWGRTPGEAPPAG